MELYIEHIVLPHGRVKALCNRLVSVQSVQDPGQSYGHRLFTIPMTAHSVDWSDRVTAYMA